VISSSQSQPFMAIKISFITTTSCIIYTILTNYSFPPWQLLKLWVNTVNFL